MNLLIDCWNESIWGREVFTENAQPFWAIGPDDFLEVLGWD